MLAGRHEAIQVKRLASEFEVQEYGHHMGQDFAHQSMLKMPPIMDANPMDSEALGQMHPEAAARDERTLAAVACTRCEMAAELNLI